MDKLIYKVSYGFPVGVINGKIEEDSKALQFLKDEYKNKFEIQVFGHAINPKEAHSPLFKCRNLVANISCTYVEKNTEKLRAGYIEEAYSKVKDTNKDLVFIECVTFDTDCKEIPEVLQALYTIVSNEAKNHFGADDVIVYWYLNDNELEIIKNNTDWCSDGTVKFSDSEYGYIILEEK